VVVWHGDTYCDGFGIDAAGMFKGKRNIRVKSVIEVFSVRSTMKLNKGNAVTCRREHIKFLRGKERWFLPL